MEKLWVAAGERDLLEMDHVGALALNVIDNLTAKCDAQAAVIERVRELLPGLGSIVEKRLIRKALAAAPERPPFPPHGVQGRPELTEAYPDDPAPEHTGLMLESELGGGHGDEDRCDWEYADWATCFTILDLFALVPRTLAVIAQVSWHGNEKHNPGQPLHHAREKSTDHADCIARHLFEAGGFDGPFRHSAAHAWRWLILSQLELEADGAPKARGAK